MGEHCSFTEDEIVVKEKKNLHKNSKVGTGELYGVNFDGG